MSHTRIPIAARKQEGETHAAAPGTGLRADGPWCSPGAAPGARCALVPGKGMGWGQGLGWDGMGWDRDRDQDKDQDGDRDQDEDRDRHEDGEQEKEQGKR